MASIEEALHAKLVGTVGISGLIAARCYPLKLPQGVTYPAASYTLIAAPRHPLMGADAGVVDALFQVSAWGTTYATAKALAVQIRTALSRWRGTASGIVVQDSFLQNESDGWEEDGQVFHVPTDVRIHYEG